jgi:hypothetical protein
LDEFIANDKAKYPNTGELSSISIAAFFMQANSNLGISACEWQLTCEHPEIIGYMELLKSSTASGSVRKALIDLFKMPSNITPSHDYYEKDSESKALAAFATTDAEEMIRNIKGWGFDEAGIRAAAAGAPCLLAASKFDIFASWSRPMIHQANMKFDTHGDSVIQGDFCEHFLYQKNINGDDVVSYSFPIPDGDGSRIGFRFTNPKSSDSTFENLISIASDWTNFRAVSGHSYKGFRLPAFKKPLTTEVLAPLKDAKARSWQVVALQGDGTFTVNQLGNRVSVRSLIIAKYRCMHKAINTDGYLDFYESNDSGWPTKFNIFAECFYVKNDGICNPVPLVSTFVNDKFAEH